jgi:hypothetical protein
MQSQDHARVNLSNLNLPATACLELLMIEPQAETPTSRIDPVSERCYVMCVRPHRLPAGGPVAFLRPGTIGIHGVSRQPCPDELPSFEHLEQELEPSEE